MRKREKNVYNDAEDRIGIQFPRGSRLRHTHTHTFTLLYTGIHSHRAWSRSKIEIAVGIRTRRDAVAHLMWRSSEQRNPSWGSYNGETEIPQTRNSLRDFVFVVGRRYKESGHHHPFSESSRSHFSSILSLLTSQPEQKAFLHFLKDLKHPVERTRDDLHWSFSVQNGKLRAKKKNKVYKKKESTIVKLWMEELEVVELSDWNFGVDVYREFDF